MEPARRDAFDISDELKALMKKEGSVVSVSLKFKDLKSNADRVRLCHDLLKSRHLLPPQSGMKTEKNDQRALEARSRGNEFFIRDKDYCQALEAYNESLCFAPHASESLAIAFANRSAVYFNAGYFRYSVQNIDLALANDYPEKLKPKLLQRKKDCLRLMDEKKPQSSQETIQLSHPSNAKIPFAVDALEYASDPQFGRFVVTKRDLKPGDIIVTEEPFSKILLKSAVYTQCTNCTSNNLFNLLPCPNSTLAMFCSESCAQTAWQRFYQFEVPVIDGLFDLFTKITLNSIRGTLKAFTMVPQPSDLVALVNEIDVGKENAFGLDYEKRDEKTEFRAVYALATNEDCRSVADLFQRANLCAIAWHMFREFTKFGDLLATKDSEDLFLELLMRFNQAAAVNYHCMCEGLRKSDEIDAIISPFSPCEYGSGSFALCSLINHSCAPNVFRFSIRGANIVVVVRPIKAGSQLFDNYGPHHCIDSLSERKKTLREQYLFDCACEACASDYPKFDNLPSKNLVPQDLNRLIEALQGDTQFSDHSRLVAKEAFGKICTFLATNDHHYPCLDISKLQEVFLMCVRLLYYPKPLELMLAPSPRE